jgi:hypothetical protein
VRKPRAAAQRGRSLRGGGGRSGLGHRSDDQFHAARHRARHRLERGTVDIDEDKIPGVGPKLAARITAELKDKTPASTPLDPAFAHLGGVEREAMPTPAQDAISALVNLGYPQMQAASAIAIAMKNAGEEPEAKTLIRLGLRELAR